MSEKLDYLITEFDFLLEQGDESIEAWHQALKDYAFVYHTDDGRLPLARASEVALRHITESNPNRGGGLYGKYNIQKADGTPVDPKGAYFVLRLDTDPAARRAVVTYVHACDNPQLAFDLSELVQAIEHHKQHDDMDGNLCPLSDCAWHYPVSKIIDRST